MTALKKQRGFTLIELFIVILMVAILTSLALPSFTNSIRDNKVQTAANSMLVAINLARSTAIQRGGYVGLCTTTTGTSCASTAAWDAGWILYTAADKNGLADTSGATILRVGGALSGATITATSISTRLMFNSRGMVDLSVSTVGDLAVNASNCTSGKNKQVTIRLNSVGRTITVAGTCP